MSAGARIWNQMNAVNAFNEAFGYELKYPLDDFDVENAIEIAVGHGREDIAKQIREAWQL